MAIEYPVILVSRFPLYEPAKRNVPGAVAYHLVELRQLLERNWQAGDRRAVAGMSAGGYEAMREADLRRFLPYDPRSAMFALEILGWGFFLGLAALCLVPVLRGPGLRNWIARLLGLYGLLGLVCALGLVLDSPVVAVGFLAWGGVLPLAAGLIAVVSRPGARRPVVVS